MKQFIKTTLRSLIGIALATFFIHKVIKHTGVNIGAEIQRSIYLLLLAATLMYGSVLLITIFRWKVLLDVQGIHLNFFVLIRLAMIGVFFNLVIPGAVSGDIVKMVYISDHSDGKTTEAVLTIMLDRVVGLFGLFIVATGSVLFSLDYLADASREIQLSSLIVGSGSVVGTVAVLVLYFRRSLQQKFGFQRLLDRVKQWLPEKILEIISRLITALDAYQNQRRVLAFVLALSIMVHTILAIVMFTLGRAFHENALSMRHYLLTTQVANAIASIPVTPSGLGIRDGVLSGFLIDAGAVEEKAGIIPSFYSIIIAGWSLLGGIFFITSKRNETRGP